MSAMRAGERETSKSVLRGGDDEDEYVRETRVSKPRSAASRQTPARAARDESVNESNAAAAGNAD
jgi:hypothetical protein